VSRSDAFAARNAREPLPIPVTRQAQQEQPDLILLNYNSLPDVDGGEVCRALKADATTRHIPVLLISSIGWPANEDREGGLGADGYLLVPFTWQELQAVILSAFARNAL
jgi:PleD family two-component response regulator